MGKRVVVTGLGVCAPNGVGLKSFTLAMQKGRSGIRHHAQLKQLGFSCQVAGEPLIKDNLLANYFSPLQLRGLNSSGLVYGVIAGSDAWRDAGLAIADKDAPDWNSGILFGTGILGADKFRESIYQIDANNVRKLGSGSVMQVMASGISAYLGGILGCGNQVTTNSSACSTGTEGVIMAYERIRAGKAARMLVGSCSDSGPYIWAGFDSMRILPRKYNDDPTRASRPMSASAAGFVPGSGAGALVLESLESAQKRGARIYAEVLGGTVNSGGQRGEGSMTAPNSEAVIRCIREAVHESGLQPSDIDTINGHLTATGKDALEIENWKTALAVSEENFPYINSFKGLFGHCLAAAGSVECVASVLQIEKGQVFGNVNCEDLNPSILEHIDRSKIPQKTILHQPRFLAKASFGFGDVNACVIFGQYGD